MKRAFEIDETHDPARTSWVSGSAPGTEFPIQNLPFCTFQVEAASKVGVGIGDAVLDLTMASSTGLFDSPITDALRDNTEGLRGIMGLPTEVNQHLRHQLSSLLSVGSDAKSVLSECLHERSKVQLALPTQPGNFTDFFSSINHARNAGELRRPENPLLPNFHHLPVAYNGRASSVRVSGVDVVRPMGQILPKDARHPTFGSTAMLDFECELAVWMGERSELGRRLPLADSPSHIFGIGLLNDWSARDIQLWESQPLGPLLSKSFLTTVSPWVITAGALAPFQIPAARRNAEAPSLLPYLEDEANSLYGGLSISLTVAIQSALMRAQDLAPHVIARPNFKDHYWTIPQMLTHLTSNGCNVSPGDLVGTGTVSGPTRSELGCLLEMTRLGNEPFSLPSGETRVWLENGDEIVITGVCNEPGFAPISLGEARARIAPAFAFR